DALGDGDQGAVRDGVEERDVQLELGRPDGGQHEDEPHGDLGGDGCELRCGGGEDLERGDLDDQRDGGERCADGDGGRDAGVHGAGLGGGGGQHDRDRGCG